MKLFNILLTSYILVICLYLNSKAEPITECKPNDIKINETFAISKKTVIYTAPNKNSKKLVNETVSKILKTTHYHTLDYSSTVNAICSRDDYVFIIISTHSAPNETSGWIPKSSLRIINKTSKGQRIYTIQDIYWDEYTSNNKKQFTNAINYLHQHNTLCMKNIDPETLTKSPSKSTKNHPIYFVTCGNSNEMRNVFFDTHDMREWSSIMSK
ncbi:hypothetical protein N1030_02345 [Desulfovibrio mangrovi]|uniref:hypothetical protein n=1 Tax=Desulfovibrio mangrovi TaxID=2976983 RepID=UPI002245A448|nr:hypothetical protein [Desulfovibrio mangrovi]UZP67834.1 hypothetical protein N1030_02345 [Desulfovibrio mangrovi]